VPLRMVTVRASRGGGEAAESADLVDGCYRCPCPD
jgi:hypothetical protein